MGPDVMPGPADSYIAYGRGWANVSNTPFREYKHWVHEGGISTPLIAHWPQGIASAGGLCQTPGHVIDVLPTLAELAQAAYPNDAPVLPGRSLAGLFRGQPLERDALFWEHEGNRAVRLADWKLVAKHEQPWELYDLSRDRVESNDRAHAMPDRVKELSDRYEAWARSSLVKPWPVGPNRAR
jgi:arylsulfatase